MNKSDVAPIAVLPLGRNDLKALASRGIFGMKIIVGVYADGASPELNRSISRCARPQVGRIGSLLQPAR